MNTALSKLDDLTGHVQILHKVACAESDEHAAVALLAAAEMVIRRMARESVDPAALLDDQFFPMLDGLKRRCRDAAREPARVGSVVPVHMFRRAAERRRRAAEALRAGKVEL